MLDYTYLYAVVAGIILLIALVIVRRLVKSQIKRNRNRIDSLKRTSPVLTSTPLDKPLKTFKLRAKDGLQQRFSIINRIILFVILLVILGFTVVPFFDQLPKTLISVFATSAAVIIGIAAKPLIENFLSGIVITYSKKLNIGDTVMIDDVYGTIEDITSIHTVVKIWDWRRFVVPNSKMLNQNIKSYSLYDSWHWTNVKFMVAPGSDLRMIRSMAIDIAKQSKNYTDIEEPSFWVMETRKDTIVCMIAAWASSPAKSWELRSDLRTEIMIALQDKGIKMHVNYHEINGEDMPTYFSS